MSKATDALKAAQEQAMKTRPSVGGFPHLAETLRTAGVTKNIWSLPSCQALYLTKNGAVVSQGTPLLSGTVDVNAFSREALILALRTNQAGESTFPEFLTAAWNAGVVSYEVNFLERKVTYYGCLGEEYVEDYPAVKI